MSSPCASSSLRALPASDLWMSKKEASGVCGGACVIGSTFCVDIDASLEKQPVVYDLYFLPSLPQYWHRWSGRPPKILSRLTHRLGSLPLKKPDNAVVPIRFALAFSMFFVLVLVPLGISACNF